MRETKRYSLLYQSSYDALRKYFKNDKLRCKIYDSMNDYEIYGIDFPAELLKNEKVEIFWDSVKPLIDARVEKYLNGKKGGRPPKTEALQGDKKPSKNQSKTTKKPNENQKETKAKPNKDKDKEVDTDKEVSTSVDNTSRREIPGGDSLAPQDGYEDGYFKPADEVWEEYKKQKGDDQQCNTNLTKMTPSDLQDT